MPFLSFQHLDIPEVVLIEPRVFEDGRGYFLETYKHADFAAAGIALPFVQTNHSHSSYGVLRGLHYQLPPMAQGKLVACIHGEIFDVAVDIRKGSPTYGHWVGEVLSAKNHRLLYIPPGFAHGFCTLSAEADVLYQTTAEYAYVLDRGIRWDDPDIDISWPIAEPLLSDKDARQPLLTEAENTFVWGYPA